MSHNFWTIGQNFEIPAIVAHVRIYSKCSNHYMVTLEYIPKHLHHLSMYLRSGKYQLFVKVAKSQKVSLILFHVQHNAQKIIVFSTNGKS